jgi:hypothetical protein
MLVRVYLIIGGLLLVAFPGAGRAQTVRCELSIYVLGYGSEGKCVIDAPWEQQPNTKPRIERTRYWQTGEVSIFISGTPTDQFPLAGHFFQRSALLDRCLSARPGTSINRRKPHHCSNERSVESRSGVEGNRTGQSVVCVSTELRPRDYAGYRHS